MITQSHNKPTDVSSTRTRDAEEQLDRMLRLGREAKTMVSKSSAKKAHDDASHDTCKKAHK